MSDPPPPGKLGALNAIKSRAEHMKKASFRSRYRHPTPDLAEPACFHQDFANPSTARVPRSPWQVSIFLDHGLQSRQALLQVPDLLVLGLDLLLLGFDQVLLRGDYGVLFL